MSVLLRSRQIRAALQSSLFMKIQAFKSPLVYSMGVHLLMLLLILTGFQFDAEEKMVVSDSKKIVQAVIINEKYLGQEIDKIRKAENKQETEKKQRLRRLEKETAAIIKERESAQKLLNKLVLDNKKLQIEEKKAGEKTLLADKKAKEAALRATEAEKLRRVAEAKYQETERTRQQAASFAEQEAETAEIGRYTEAIHDRVRRFFNVLPNFEGLKCVLDIRLLPDGNVAAVSVRKSSGNEVFDRHAENAVRKSTPFPVPGKPALFKKMQRISFVFDPKF